MPKSAKTSAPDIVQSPTTDVVSPSAKTPAPDSVQTPTTDVVSPSSKTPAPDSVQTPTTDSVTSPSWECPDTYYRLPVYIMDQGQILAGVPVDVDPQSLRYKCEVKWATSQDCSYNDHSRS